jgi:glycosidase
MAEVYWDMEWTLQQQGFDYAYDKRLYDRLCEAHAKAVREHFYAGLDYQDKLARFLENHDEPRAAATFDQETHEAAAVITFLSPGLRFFHQGQFTGRKKRISPHLVRAPHEPINTALQKFYGSLLDLLKKPIFRNGKWSLLECVPAWEENNTWDSFIVFAWEGTDGNRALVCVNYSPQSGQCYVRLPFPELAGKQWKFDDLMSEASYNRAGNNLLKSGLYLDMLAWNYHVFEIKNIK